MNLSSRIAAAFFTLSCVCAAQTPDLTPAAVPNPNVEIKPLGPGRPPNSLPMYRALRSITPSGEAFQIEGVTLKRDGGELTLHKGAVYLYPAVNGHVTGAVFLGTGPGAATFHMVPPNAMEQKSLSRLTKSNEMTQDFQTLVMRFTDDTAAELKKVAVGTAVHNAAADAAGAVLVEAFRKRLHINLDERILRDVTMDAGTGFGGGVFLASFKSTALAGKNVLYWVDPHRPERDEVQLSTFEEGRVEIWTSFGPLKPEDLRSRGAEIQVTHQGLDIGIEKNGRLTGSAVTTMTVLHANVKVVPLSLFPELRVSGVFGPTGLPLDFIQEGPEEDPQYAVVLAEPAAQGEEISIRTVYAGKDVVFPEGDGNYYPNGAARDDWYPSGSIGFGSYCDFHMVFHVPKGLTVVATGQRVSGDEKGPLAVSVWQTDDPIEVAGFNLGAFKESQSKTSTGLEVDAYANWEVPDFVKPLLGNKFAAIGTLETTSALKRTLSEGDAAVEVYSNFFGPLPYDHLALTQQSACNYGQSWPMLVFLPVCYFYDDTVRNRLGLMARDPSYWTTVTPHEVSHQWWGQTVGFASYRDQWMSEGFANFSASLYLLYTEPKMDSYREYWSLQRKQIMDKNAQGIRPIDVGPVTMGLRLNSEKTGGDIYQRLIYAKGAYIMHMLELMYWSPEQKEEPLKKSMHEFVNRYRNRAATTEQFKEAMEKNMPAWMDIDGNKRLDWFFNAYVYGTALPHYEMTSEFVKSGDADAVHIKLTQSNVTDGFHMLVPIYIDMGNGNITRLLNVTMKGNNTLDKTVKLGKLPGQPKRLLLNYNYDVLSDN